MKFVRTLVAAAGCVVCAALFLSGVSPAADRVVTVGFQKYGNLILLKGRGGLESRLAPLGFRVEWREFPSGPPLLEALNAGAIDFGQTGETPPIFAQAAGVPLVYAGYEPPAPQGEAILVAKDDSRAKSVDRSQGQEDRAQQGLQRSLSVGPCAGKSWPEIFGD